MKVIYTLILSLQMNISQDGGIINAKMMQKWYFLIISSFLISRYTLEKCLICCDRLKMTCVGLQEWNGVLCHANKQMILKSWILGSHFTESLSEPLSNSSLGKIQR